MGIEVIAAFTLKPDVLKGPLRACGYRPNLLRTDVEFGEANKAPLVGFAQFPTDSRSACVVVLAETPEPRKAVEACRPVGAPLVFVCSQDSLQWWKQGTESAHWLESIPAPKIEQFFHAHENDFSPEAVYRAKTLGRVRSEYQLDFVDVGVMPLIEEEVGSALGRLISRSVSSLKKRLGWDEVTSAQGQWLLQSIFWLVSGKILCDKQVPGFEDIDLENVDDVFVRVARHYGTAPFSAGSKLKLEALRESARTIEHFANLALTTTESLAYVYENTLISKATRSQLGTHSTPSYLVDYVLGHLADWIEEIPEHERSVFEPACGHAAFLVAAMRLLTQLLPTDKAVPSRRGPYLRSRLHGTDIDAFAIELARLSLTLTDIPNPDGWDLRPEDMFVGNRLAEQTRGKTILLANPPFANFEKHELDKYAKTGTEIGVNNKAAELLRLTLPVLEPGSVFGVVLPQTVLHGAFAQDVRRFLIDNFELREVALFPDKVFPFSDAESAIVIGRRLPARTTPDGKLRFRRVRERQMARFRETFDAPGSRFVDQSRFGQSVRWQMRVPDLEEVWLALSDNPRASELAEFGTGLVYHSRDLPPGVATYSDDEFAGAKLGFIRFQKGLEIHQIAKLYWMNLAEEAILRHRAGTVTDMPQVLLNYAPVSRGPWRLKALVDRIGRPVASRFLTVRPRSCSLEVLWAILNSPVANAYAFTHLGKRDNIVGDMRKIPMPAGNEFEEIDLAARDYLTAATGRTSKTDLKRLMACVDAAVLRQYALPLELEYLLLSLFTDWKRVGVPFEQTRFLSAELEGRIHYAEFVDYEADWSKANRRRGELIDKDIAGALTPLEQSEPEALQAYADYYVHQVAPRPTHILDALEQLALAKSTKRNEIT